MYVDTIWAEEPAARVPDGGDADVREPGGQLHLAETGLRHGVMAAAGFHHGLRATVSLLNGPLDATGLWHGVLEVHHGRLTTSLLFCNRT
jgi:hypothetical protein